MKVLLQNVLPVDLLTKHIEEGVVRKQVHPDYPDQLYILNYSERAQFERIWDAVTNVCRGLIVAVHPDGDYVIARGFNKFHNLNTEYIPETMEANLPMDAPPLATQKLDGSMGILYTWDNKLWVATRGSFASDQAKWATDWIRQYLTPRLWEEDRHKTTAVFEIIYKSNRIVVNYDFEGLVLLGMIDVTTGDGLSREYAESFAELAGLQIVKRFNKTLAECAAENNLNEEGYVLTYSNGVKVKVKFLEYCRLHRILTGLNPKAIWEMLSAKQTEAVDVIIADPTMPAPFVAWFSGWVEQLRGRYRKMEREALRVFDGRPKNDLEDSGPAPYRKAVAMYFQKTPALCSILFAMLDDKNVAPIIWDRLKPKATDTFKKDGE